MRVQLCYTDAVRREGAVKQRLPKRIYLSFIRPHSFFEISEADERALIDTMRVGRQ